MIRIAGRGWRGGVVRITPTGEGLHVRIDDDWNPELWFEITLEAGIVICLGNAVSTLRDAPDVNAGPLGFVWGERRPGAAHVGEDTPPHGIPLDPLSEFYAAWRHEESCGHCGGMGGAEFKRVLREWIASEPRPEVREFIRRRANVGPTGD